MRSFSRLIRTRSVLSYQLYSLYPAACTRRAFGISPFSARDKKPDEPQSTRTEDSISVVPETISPNSSISLPRSSDNPEPSTTRKTLRERQDALRLSKSVTARNTPVKETLDSGRSTFEDEIKSESTSSVEDTGVTRSQTQDATYHPTSQGFSKGFSELLRARELDSIVAELASRQQQESREQGEEQVLTPHSSSPESRGGKPAYRTQQASGSRPNIRPYRKPDVTKVGSHDEHTQRGISMAEPVNLQRIANPVLLVCDVQEKFRSAIWEFEKVISTTQKMVKAAKLLNIPIFATTQNAARLGQTVSEVQSLMPDQTPTIDKTAFSMLVPELQDHLNKISDSSLSVIIVGIETHICVTQTTIDLLSRNHKVYVLADGVSSCNASERPIALSRLAKEGAVVTTSESLLFELLGDAKSSNFKAVSGLVKETKEVTKSAVETLCRL